MCFHIILKFISLIAKLILGLLQVQYLNEIQITGRFFAKSTIVSIKMVSLKKNFPRQKCYLQQKHFLAKSFVSAW